MQYVAPALSAIHTVGGVVSNVRAGSYAAKASNVEAQSEITAANYNAALEQRKNAIVLGKGRATAAASGLDTSSGSLLDIALESARQGALDESSIRYGGAQRAATIRTRGQILQQTGVNRGIAAGVGGAGSILGDLYDRYGGGSSKAFGGTITSPSSWASTQPAGKFTISG